MRWVPTQMSVVLNPPLAKPYIIAQLTYSSFIGGSRRFSNIISLFVKKIRLCIEELGGHSSDLKILPRPITIFFSIFRLDLDACKNRVRKARSMIGQQSVSLYYVIIFFFNFLFHFLHTFIYLSTVIKSKYFLCLKTSPKNI